MCARTKIESKQVSSEGQLDDSNNEKEDKHTDATPALYVADGAHGINELLEVAECGDATVIFYL